MYETFSLLNIFFIQVEHPDGIRIKFAKYKRLVNTDTCRMKIACNKFVLTNIITNAVTVSSTAGFSVYNARLK